MLNRLFATAPMMKRTDPHALRFFRLLSKNVLLYTEMINAQTICFSGKAGHFLWFSKSAAPVALQLGGRDPKYLAKATQYANAFGYSEINLNVGCPSERVKRATFGACLMKTPELVRDCIAAIADNTSVPVTLKCRLGVDNHQDYAFLQRFVQITSEAPCSAFIVHARIALLEGLSPKENRTIPPLRYNDVYRLKRDFPHLTIIINGGIQTVDETSRHLSQVDGVMLGRAVYKSPYLLALLQQALIDPHSLLPDRTQILQDYLPYVEEQLARQVSFQRLSRPVLGLFQGCPGAAAYRRYISEKAHLPNADGNLLLQAANAMHQQARSRKEWLCVG